MILAILTVFTQFPLLGGRRIKKDLVGHVRQQFADQQEGKEAGGGHFHLLARAATQAVNPARAEDVAAVATEAKNASANVNATTALFASASAAQAAEEEPGMAGLVGPPVAPYSPSAQVAAIAFILLVLLLFTRWITVDIPGQKALPSLHANLETRLETHDVLLKKLKQRAAKITNSSAQMAESSLLQRQAEFKDFLERAAGGRVGNDAIPDMRHFVVMWLRVFEHYFADPEDADLHVGEDTQLRKMFANSKKASHKSMVEAFEGKSTLPEITHHTLTKHMGNKVGVVRCELQEVAHMPDEVARLTFPHWVQRGRFLQEECDESDDEEATVPKLPGEGGRWTKEGFYPVHLDICSYEVLIHTWWHLLLMILLLVGFCLVPYLHTTGTVPLGLAVVVDLCMIIPLYMVYNVQDIFESTWTEKYIVHLETEMTKMRKLRATIDSQTTRMEGVVSLWRFCTVPQLRILAQVQDYFVLIHSKTKPASPQAKEAFSNILNSMEHFLDLHVAPLFYGPLALPERKCEAIQSQMECVSELFAQQTVRMAGAMASSPPSFSSGGSRWPTMLSRTTGGGWSSADEVVEGLEAILQSLQTPMYYLTIRLRSLGPLPADKPCALKVKCGLGIHHSEIIRKQSHTFAAEKGELVFRTVRPGEKETVLQFDVMDMTNQEQRSSRLGTVGIVGGQDFVERPGQWLQKKKQFVEPALPKTEVHFSVVYGDLVSLLDESHDCVLPDINAAKEKLYHDEKEKTSMGSRAETQLDENASARTNWTMPSVQSVRTPPSRLSPRGQVRAQDRAPSPSFHERTVNV